MRILFVVHGYVPEALGGVEVHCHNLASALAEHHEVGVLSRRADPNRRDHAVEETRVGSVTVWWLNNCQRDLGSFEGLYRDARIDEIFDRILEGWRPDVVHVHHLIGLSVGILERTKRRGLPLVLGLHDYWFGCPRGQRIRDGLKLCHEIDRNLCVTCLKPQNYEARASPRPLHRWLRRVRLPTRRRGLRLLREYDHDMHHVLALPDVIVTPGAFHREMYARYGVDAGRIRVMSNAHPTTGFAGVEHTPASHVRIGFLGTLIPSKGPHVLLEAYRLLGRPESTLDFYGNWVPFHGDHGYLDRLKAAAALVPGTICFHGRYEPDEVPGILASLDILVLPSVWYECAPVVLREGFLAGVPVVSSGHGGLAEMIEHGVNGLLFRPDDAADLAAQLRRLVDDPDLRRRLAARSPRVSSIEETAAAHVELYESLVPAGTSGSEHRP
jgi:glycosyltransferase involved in cell wall biosynthesis